MGRTRILSSKSKAHLKHLHERKAHSEKKKYELIKYLERLKEKYHLNELTYARYVEIIHQKRNGRTIEEWIHFFHLEALDCHRQINDVKKFLRRKKIVTVLLMSFILITLISFFSNSQSIVGFFTQDSSPSQDFSLKSFHDNLNEKFTETSVYEWNLENTGRLNVVKLTGSIEGEGEVKVYLNDLLVLDSLNIQASGLRSITAFAVDDIAEESNSDENIEEVSQEDSSPSPEEPSQSETSNSDETSEESSLEDSSPSQEDSPSLSETKVRVFKEHCDETCLIANLNLTNDSYTLRIEIDDAKLNLDKIDYQLIYDEEVAEEVIVGNETQTEKVQTDAISNTTIKTVQHQAVIGQPVRWTKEIKLDNEGQVKVMVPKEAENITAYKINNGQRGIASTDLNNKQREKISLTGFAISNPSDDSIIVRFFRRVFAGLTGRVVSEDIEITIEDNSSEYELEYYTEAPTAVEENITGGKRVTINGPDELHYQNILAFSYLDKEVSSLKLYHLENGSRVEVQFNSYDNNGNGLIDYIQWGVPHLSEQVYELIIEITGAEYLDSNREFISDIYNETSVLDDVWSEEIIDGHYVRVTFESNLTSDRDITVYSRTVSGNPRIQVYEKDGTEVIAEFESLNDNEANKVYLTGLNGSQDTFDLLILNGSVEFDYIVDPDSTTCIATGGTKTTYVNASGTNFTVHTFLTNGTFNVTGSSCAVDYLVVAGGGGGGENGGGGGGAGGFRNGTLSVSAINYTVTVGEGGHTNYPNRGTKGGDSSFGGIINSTGGGGGGSRDGTEGNGGTGGSGGAGGGNDGATGGAGNTPATTPSQGNDGGNSAGSGATQVGGGGGGAGATGGTGTGGGKAGNGGNGKTSDIRNGSAVYYAGGGGGAPTAAGSVGDGGLGGGGAGEANGTANTGGGAGGEIGVPYNGYGGSGIVIIRYLTTVADTTAPIVNITYPLNTTYTINVSALNYTITETNLGSCWYSRDSGLTNSTAVAAGTNFTNVISVEGSNTWRVYCNDTTGNLNFSSVTFVKNIVPTVTLSYPPANYVNSTSQYVNLTFNASVSDDIQLENCSLWHNYSGTWLLNQTQDVSGTSNVTNFTLNNLNNKIFIWNIECYDNSSNSAFNSTNRTVILNWTTPTPQITSLVLNSTNGTNYTIENLTVYSTLSIEDAKAIYNWRVNGTSRAILHMPFEGLGGNETTFVKDYSTYENNGTINISIGPIYSYTAGRDGFGAYEFDGFNDVIVVNNDSEFNITGAVSMFAWIKPNDIGFYDRIIAKSSVSPVPPYTIYGLMFDSEQHLRVELGKNDLQNSFNGKTTINPNEWQHVGFTYDGLTVRVYLNGAEDSNESFIGPIDTNEIPITIGASYYLSNYFNGTIDDVIIFNKTLTPKQIQAIYNNRTDLMISQETIIGENWTVLATPNNGFYEGYSNLSNYVLVEPAETIAPIIILHAPDNNSEINFSSVLFNWTAIDADPVMSCDLIIDGILKENDVPSANNTPTSRTVDYLTYNNQHFWNVTCEDENNNLNTSETRVFNITNLVPTQNNPILLTSNGDLICQAQNVQDGDLDSVKNITQWYVDGSKLEFMNMPFENNNFYQITMAEDLANGNNGTLVSTPWNSTGGYDGKGAYEFNAEDSYMTFPSTDFGNEFTFTTWIKPQDNSDGSSAIISSIYDSTQSGFLLRLNNFNDTNADLEFLRGPNPTSDIINGSIQLNTWQHVAVVYNNTNGIATLYLNGQNLTTYNYGGQTGINMSRIFYIGATTVLSLKYKGSIDDVRIYKRLLSQEQIQKLYENKTNEISFNETVVGENWTCEIILNDGKMGTAPSVSNNLTIVPSNASPQITYISPIESVNPVEASSTLINFYITMYDGNGVADLNDSSVHANFSRPGQTTRQNSSCVHVNDIDATSANYSCTIDMWYFDEAGDWNITVYGEDLNGHSGVNTSETFQYNLLQAMIINPNSINFTINSDASNQTANNDPTVINNTGNYNMTGKIAINAINLLGESVSAEYLAVENFSIGLTTGGEAECAGTNLQNATDVNITGVVLERGNLSAGQAQEELYYCIQETGIITAQTYSTQGAGSWLIKIALSLVVVSTKNRKKKRKLIAKDLSIPSKVFVSELGPLESLTKYLKENLGMTYHEIAELLNRNDRTIWTAYNKSLEKQKVKIDTKESLAHIPVSIFNNRKLTILEAVVVYLKQNGMKYVEIGKLLDRDQRNIWTVYSRSMKK